MTQPGMSRDDLLQGLSQYLPQVVDQLTPEGRLPAGRARIAEAQRERWRVYRESVRPANLEDNAGSER
jgi:hypothetical protein